MKKEMYVAECPKCKMVFRGSEKYFRFDLKEKCFDGITELVNYRLEGDTYDAWADAMASKMISNALAWLEAEKAKVLAE
jgi:hypothetical protein